MRAFVLVLALAWACAGTRSSDRVEESVHPGINDPYHDPDVAEWEKRFEREGREIFDRRHDVVEACGIEPGETVADVGSGTGLFVPFFSDRVGAEGRVFAVDIVPKFVEHIRAKVAAEGRTNVEVVLGTERSCRLPEDEVDLAFVCDTYHHFEYPKSTMSSIWRALRRGGELVVVDFERKPGQSSDWVLGHVRAGKSLVRTEIEAIGFELVEEVPLLETNYFLRFEKP